jgi:CTP-dependent riboflavin kinase
MKAFEHFDRIAKVFCREFAHTVHDSLRDAARTLPLSSNKSRPVTSSEKASSGLTIQEEVFSVLEKLYKSYLKD